MRVILKRNWRWNNAGDEIEVTDQKTLNALLGQNLIHEPPQRYIKKPVKKTTVVKKTTTKKTTAGKKAVKK